MDKTMQESVVFYDPATQVIVFVLLPSKSGNSVAMWRRKIQVPNDTRLLYEQYITQAIAGLRKELDYTVYVDRWVLFQALYVDFFIVSTREGCLWSPRIRTNASLS